MNQKRDIPLFIIDSSRSHGRGHEKDFVACTSRELPWVGEITILNERELEIDQDWQKRNTLCAYTDPNEAGIRAKLKVVSVSDGSPRRKISRPAIAHAPLSERVAHTARHSGGGLGEHQQRGGSEVCQRTAGADPREPTREPEGQPGVYGWLHTEQD